MDKKIVHDDVVELFLDPSTWASISAGLLGMMTQVSVDLQAPMQILAIACACVGFALRGKST